MNKFDLASLNDSISFSGRKNHLLSGTTVSLALSALTDRATYRGAWTGQTDTEWDTAETLVDLAIKELMGSNMQKEICYSNNLPVTPPIQSGIIRDTLLHRYSFSQEWLDAESRSIFIFNKLDVSIQVVIAVIQDNYSLATWASLLSPGANLDIMPFPDQAHTQECQTLRGVLAEWTTLEFTAQSIPTTGNITASSQFRG